MITLRFENTDNVAINNEPFATSDQADEVIREIFFEKHQVGLNHKRIYVMFEADQDMDGFIFVNTIRTTSDILVALDFWNDFLESVDQGKDYEEFVYNIMEFTTWERAVKFIDTLTLDSPIRDTPANGNFGIN